MDIKVLFVSAAAVALTAGVAPTVASAQNANPASMLLNSLENMPRAKGAEMANELVGENTFKVDGTEEKAKQDTRSALHIPVRKFSENMDPVTADAVRALDGAGVLRRQTAMAEGIILMEQQMRYAQQIEKLLEQLGPDALIEVSPGLFQSFENTPVAMNAKKKQLELQKELAELQAEVSSGTLSKSLDGKFGTEVGASPKLQTRPDGSDFSAFPVTSMPPTALPQMTGEPFTSYNGEGLDELREQIALTEERLAQQERRLMSLISSNEEPEASVVEKKTMASEWASQMSIKEIFGGFGNLTAVIDIKGSERTVKVGNRLPGGYDVRRITEEYVEISREGDVAKIRF
jgi:type IV pilus biogenesis protein PilP